MATGRLPDPNTAPVTAKGDLYTYSTVPAKLAVGSNGETLVADSSTSTGLRYQGNFAAGKNKLINANMVIDQRNAGASVTINNTPGVFAVDRWFGSGVPSDGVFTLQQDSSAPSGFTKSIKATMTTIDTSIPATGGYNLTQIVEGFNIVDLGYGAAGAKTTTLSFWVRSSVTGTFGGSLRNSATNRSYPFTYSISVADTWEQKSITIAGDTSGTWLTDSGVGIRLTFAFGSGADRLGTAGAWAATSYNGATGQTQLIGTLNATWYVTGVQLEVGSVATAFQTATGTLAGEFSACCRYYQRLNAAGSGSAVFGSGFAGSTTVAQFVVPTITKLRTTSPDLTTSSVRIQDYGAAYTPSAIVLTGSNADNSVCLQATATGLTAYRPMFIDTNGSGYVGLSSEL